MQEIGVIMARDFARLIIRSFKISDDFTRIAFISFGYATKIMIHFSSFFTKAEVLLEIKEDYSFNDTASVNETTMNVMDLLFSSDFGSRDDVSRYLIFLSNGKFTDKIGSRESKEFRKRLNVKMLVAGVGMEIEKVPLEELVEDTEKDIFIGEESFCANEMIQRIHELTDEFCDIKERPPTFPPSTVSP
ncbi:hypothetical protein QZH41_011336 [Actinostola sp. cb2023]|nr:hypothetical protein QZH41_011336 [Actinostola sp. cb2023]